MEGIEIPEFAKEWANEHGNVISIKVNTAVVGLDLLWGGGNHKHQRCGLLGGGGGSGGMVNWKFLKYRVSEIAFSAFQGINFQQFLTN